MSIGIGIEIGSTKTVIASTNERGIIVNDELGNREIPTVVERTFPIRRFGKSVNSDNVNDLKVRKRFFLNNLTSPGSQENVLMFLNYLDRVVNRAKVSFKSGALAIPEYFGEEEKLILKSIVEVSDLKITNFITHLTSVAACAALRTGNISSQYMIVDCGYSKTSVGTFSFEDGKVVPLKRWTVKIGSSCFDSAVSDIIIRKYNLPDNEITREKLYKEVKTIKKGLNVLSNVTIKLVDENYNTQTIEVLQEEYLKKIEPYLEELRNFFLKVKEESEFDGYTEVVGNNSYNVHIQQILKGLSYNTTLNSSESAALGACLAVGVNRMGGKYHVHEILGYNIFLKIQNENGKPKLVFDANSIIAPEPTKVKYNRKESFNIDVYQNDKVIGCIEVSKSVTDSPESVNLSVRINPFMTFEVFKIECESECNYVYKSYGISEEEKDALRNMEKRLRDAELEKELRGEMVNYIESFMESFVDKLKKSFSQILTSEDFENAVKIQDEFFDSELKVDTLDEAKAIKQNLFKKLEFLSKKVSGSLKEDIENFIKETENKINYKHSTYSVLSLKTVLNDLKAYCKNFELDIESAVKYNSEKYEEYKKQIASLFFKAELEQKAEETKIQEEAKRKEEAKAKENKKEDEMEKDSLENDKNCNTQDGELNKS